MLRLIPISLAIVGLVACNSGPTAPVCDLTVDTVAGKTFVMSEAQVKGPDKLNPLARMKFFDEGGKIKLKYTAKSVDSVYTYDCSKVEKKGKDPELKCVEPARLADWCMAMFAHDIKCTRKKLRKLGTDATDEELDKAIAIAKASKARVKDNENAKKAWRRLHASLANKLQGQVYAKVDSRCRLHVDDMYWTLRSDGKKVEDTNPVGSNPFVSTDEPWMFENCDNHGELYDGDKASFPSLPITVAPTTALGKEIHYYHIGDAGSKAEEGCTYSFETYANWKPLDKGGKPVVEGDRLVWHVAHTFDEKTAMSVLGKTVGIFHMARFKECAGKKEKIDVSCRTTIF